MRYVSQEMIIERSSRKNCTREMIIILSKNLRRNEMPNLKSQSLNQEPMSRSMQLHYIPVAAFS